MECPNCRTVNPEAARFCFNCGASLALACTHCGTQLSPAAKFCHNCGRPVSAPAAQPAPQVAPRASAAPAADPALARLEQYIPKELLARLQAARAGAAMRGMEGERRIVTVLFCDVKGSTAMAENLDPEEWAEIMNGAFKYLIEPVYRYEGTLARLMGDAILAFFGAPIAHEDDPHRAVLAGLDIVEAIKPYREQVRRERGLDLNVRIGISTGLVVVGEVGSDLRVEYTAMGDTVNVASRMEQLAEPGTVQISGSTHKSVADLFDFESLGHIEVKGKAEPVEAYRVVGKRAGAVPSRGIEGLASPLVGRDRELDTLLSCIQNLQEGRGQVVSVIGEAGLGKSRLLAETRKAVAARGLLSDGRTTDDGQQTTNSAPTGTGRPSPVVSGQWYEGRSLSYETATPYAPFISLFTNLFGLGAGESDNDRYAKIRARVDEIVPGQGDETAPFLATVLNIAMPTEDNERVRYLEPPMLRGRVFHAVAALVEGLARQGPVVLTFEDLHWADHTSLELFEQLLPLTDRSMLMLVALFRPNRQDPSWRFHETASRDYEHRYTQVALEPLDEANARTLVGNLLEIEDLPEKVRALILQKAEGNPFFVEEVIRSLLDARLVVREGGHWRAVREIENVAVPDTLAGVITARLDRLNDESKRVAQTASVIGREFGFDTLSEVYEAPAVLDGALGDLQRRELVLEKSRMPSRDYLFKHGLTQETAYSSILLSKRRELHRRVAECLERLAPERVNHIARHFIDAREEARALPYLVEAGDRAARSAARDEAIGYYRQALDITQRVEEPTLARRAYEGLGKTLEFAGDGHASFETYHQMLHYAKERGDVPMEVSALNKMSYMHAFVMGQFPEAESHLEDAERLAREADDAAGLVELYTLKCGMCTMKADFSSADKYLTEAAELGRKMDHKDTWAYGLAHKSNTLIYLAEFDKAWEAAKEGLRVAEEAGNQERKAEILSFANSMYHLHNGDLEAARRSAEEGVEIARKIGAPVPAITGAYVLGTIAQMRGDYEQALKWHEGALDKARPLIEVFPFLVAIPLSALGAACFALSDKLVERVKEYHSETLGLLGTPGGAPAGGSAWADLGFCALALDEVDAAERYFQNGLKMPSTQMYLQKPRLLAGVALVALAKDRPDEAASYAEQARAYAAERSMKHFYPLTTYVEGRVNAAAGRMERALELYAQAEAVAREMEMRPLILQAREGAVDVLSKLGREGGAEAKRAEARVTIQEMAGLFQDEQLRTQFMESALRRLDTSAPVLV